MRLILLLVPVLAIAGCDNGSRSTFRSPLAPSPPPQAGPPVTAPTPQPTPTGVKGWVSDTAFRVIEGGRSAGARDPIATRPGELGDAEIQNFHASIVRQEDVLRLHITMDDASVVRGRESFRNLARVVDRRAGRECASLQSGAERFAFEELRHDVRRAGVDADIVDGEDVG